MTNPSSLAAACHALFVGSRRASASRYSCLICEPPNATPHAAAVLAPAGMPASWSCCSAWPTWWCSNAAWAPAPPGVWLVQTLERLPPATGTSATALHHCLSESQCMLVAHAHGVKLLCTSSNSCNHHLQIAALSRLLTRDYGLVQRGAALPCPYSSSCCLHSCRWQMLARAHQPPLNIHAAGLIQLVLMLQMKVSNFLYS